MPDTSSGTVFDVSRGCTEDGPGLRTVVFFKGCGLGCPWCHNPEGKSFQPQILFDLARCIGCKSCERACPSARPWWSRLLRAPWDWRAGCTACGRCAEACPSRARRLSGREVSADVLCTEVMADMDFFEGTGGGVTFSGGEPLAQPDFLFSCAARLRDSGVHLAVETSGFWPPERLDGIRDLFDLVLFDLKHVNPAPCRRVLGTGNDTALANLLNLLGTDMPVELRITLVPGFNDSDDDLLAMAAWLKTCARLPQVRLQPFHRLALAKQDLLGRPYPYADLDPTPPRKLMHAADLMRGEGIPCIGP